MLFFSAANFKPSSGKLVRDYYNKSKGTRVRLLIRVLCVYASLYTFDARNENAFTLHERGSNDECPLIPNIGKSENFDSISRRVYIRMKFNPIIMIYYAAGCRANKSRET
jgi:hypothetical protein